MRPEDYRGYLLVLARAVHARRLMRHGISVRDLVQDALLQAHVAGDQFRGKTEEEYKGWLRRILGNKMADASRHLGMKKRDAKRNQPFQEALDVSAPLCDAFLAQQSNPLQHAMRREMEERLAEALMALPEQQADAVSLHHLRGMPFDEVAAEMGKTRASVAGLIRRGLRTLREKLKDLEEDYGSRRSPG
jgi:RNA polymerase sigma-70 factor (ECF subfamily)